MKFNNSVGTLFLILSAILLLPVNAFATRILTYSDHESLGNMRTRFLNDVLFPAIEKESGGRLKIEAHWGGELSAGYDALRYVGKDGKVDLAVVVPEYAANDLPLNQIFKSFPVGPSGNAQVAFFRRVYSTIPAFPAELKKNNVVPIFLATGYPLSFFSTKTMAALNDIKGGTWRSASFWHRDFLQNAGANPVTMPWGEETYQALKSGAIDGMMLNVDSGYDLKAYQFAPSVLISKDLWLGHLYILAMNEKTWNKLSTKDQIAIQRAAQTAYQSLGAVMDSSFNTQIDDLRKAGATVRILKPEEVTQWKTATRYQAAQDKWVKEQEAKGTKDAGSVMAQVGIIMDEMMNN
ncbi:TRAP transporter substrate-binding protein DctP [Enterobacillus tribolii]|uniref:TRAP-type C4-dicarboxylate transport system substrate-binding protein n=1 Tax=Enterobacillus tribolii TaxID=1487935 RepID=A0A370R1V3_9GAMM|nr:TRAP transporter substrate-binding protein DctP [Enterobacillus tribolii]MBW7982903.1 ABC transporter substrate-binding protein [Enterobacillus tribolii]RDK95536.1 TRAP-type C4-dicarboxylate transport system substrate-binding protein [Enterobacillus tribolii]